MVQVKRESSKLLIKIEGTIYDLVLCNRKLTRNDELTGKSAIQGNNRVFLHKVKFLIPTL